MAAPLPEPKIAKEYRFGNTRAKIATNYCEDKTPEDIQRILDRIAVIAIQDFQASANT